MVYFTSLGTLQKWNHTLFILLCLPSVTQYHFVCDCTGFITFTKPFNHAHTRCQEIKYNMKRNTSLLLFSLLWIKGRLHSAALAWWPHGEHFKAQANQNHLHSESLSRTATVFGGWTNSLAAVIDQPILEVSPTSLNQKRPYTRTHNRPIYKSHLYGFSSCIEQKKGPLGSAWTKVSLCSQACCNDTVLL